MPDRERRQLDAIDRIQRLFLSGEEASVLQAEMVAAAGGPAGGRSGFLVDEVSPDEPEVVASSGGGETRVLIPLVGRSGPAGALVLVGVPEPVAELFRDLAPFLDGAAIMLRACLN